MLYVFHGSDVGRVADKANSLVATLRSRRADALVFTFEETETQLAALDELLDARGLFIDKHIVHIKATLYEKEERESLVERLEKFAKSPNVVVLALGKLDARHKEQVESHAVSIEEHIARETTEREHNAFAMGDALGVRNRRRLWVEYALARRADIAPQALHGTLLWAVRSMVLASRASSATEAGLKPNVYTKFKRYATNYTHEELYALSRNLVSIYHDAYRGQFDLDTALERWTLTV